MKKVQQSIAAFTSNKKVRTSSIAKHALCLSIAALISPVAYSDDLKLNLTFTYIYQIQNYTIYGTYNYIMSSKEAYTWYVI